MSLDCDRSEGIETLRFHVFLAASGVAGGHIEAHFGKPFPMPVENLLSTVPTV